MELASGGFVKNGISMENSYCLDESNRLNQGRPSGHPRSLKIGKENHVEKIFDKPTASLHGGFFEC